MADSKLHENVRNQAQDTAKTEEKAGKYKPLVVFDTAAGVSGPRWLSGSWGQRLCEWHQLAVQVSFWWESNHCCDLKLFCFLVCIGIRQEMLRERQRQLLVEGWSPHQHISTTAAAPAKAQRNRCPGHPLHKLTIVQWVQNYTFDQN